MVDDLYLDIRQLSTDIIRDSATSFRFDRHGLDLANYHLLSREIEQRYHHRVRVSVLEDNVSPTLLAANSPVMPKACGSLVPSTETSSLAPASNNNIASVALQVSPVPKPASVVDVSTLSETIPRPGSTEGMPEMYVSKHPRLVGKKDDRSLSLRLEWSRKTLNVGCVVLLVLFALFSLALCICFWLLDLRALGFRFCVLFLV